MNTNLFSMAFLDNPLPTPAEIVAVNTQVGGIVGKYATEVVRLAKQPGMHSIPHALSVTVRKFGFCEARKTALFRKRRGAEVLADGFVTGCSDVALVFMTLAHAIGYPARLVDTLDAPWLLGRTFHCDRQVCGHVYVDLWVDERWWPYDPAYGFIEGRLYRRKDKTRGLVFARGLSYDRLALQDPATGLYTPAEVEVTSVDTLRAIAEAYRARI